MKNSKNYSFTALIIFLFLSFTNNPFSQHEFKNIKNADDVIENYMIALGGKSKLEKIESYRLTGTANFFGNIVNYDEYADSNKFYLNIGNDTMKVIKFAINDTSRWVESYKDGDDTISVIDISDKHHNVLNGYFITYNFFYFFLKYKNYNLKIHFDSSFNNEKIILYKITFYKSDSLMCTAEFNSRNFFLNKFIVEAPTENILGLDKLAYKFEDYKEIIGAGLKMPYTIIRNEMVPIEISDYTFNSKIDEDLIKNPNSKK